MKLTPAVPLKLHIVCHSGSDKPYAFTQQSRKGSTCLKAFFLSAQKLQFLDLFPTARTDRCLSEGRLSGILFVFAFMFWIIIQLSEIVNMFFEISARLFYSFLLSTNNVGSPSDFNYKLTQNCNRIKTVANTVGEASCRLLICYSLFLCIFPLVVLGRESLNTTSLGYL